MGKESLTSSPLPVISASASRPLNATKGHPGHAVCRGQPPRAQSGAEKGRD